MKISYRWCQQFFADPLPAADALASVLTDCGLEVETLTPVAVNAGVVLGRVQTCTPHANADRLQVCEVDVGDGGGAVRTIICGAPNVAAGQWVAVATPGAVLAGLPGVKISKRKIRGVESDGMICSEKELGVGDDDDGILVFVTPPMPPDAAAEAKPAAAGEDLADYLFFNDTILEVAITPNRGDCLSHLGIAREVAAALDLPLRAPTIYNNKTAGSETFAVGRAAGEHCPYYGCLLIRGITAGTPVPAWLRTLLLRCGERSISAVVDITNYLMLAFGQPLHAFDAARLRGKSIGVRHATAGERVALLDGQSIDCDTDALLITDAEVPVALGGVMGGSESAVSDATTDVLLEAAHFTPAAVRGKTRQYHLSSQAAYRFERGVSSHLPPVALSHAARWIATLCGGKLHPLHADGEMSAARQVHVPLQQVNALLGMDFSAATAAALLNRLSLTTTVERDADGGEVLASDIPPWRFDLHQPVDLVEEIIRMHGYNHLPATRPRGARAMHRAPQRLFTDDQTRAFFVGENFYEMVGYAFVSPQWEADLSAHTPLPLANPMQETGSVMRTTLLGGLLDRALHNSRHRQECIRLFELGRCFLSADNGATIRQPNQLAGVACGQAAPTQWGQPARAVDFYDLKGVLERYFRNRAQFSFAPPPADTQPPAYHPHQCAQIFCGTQSIGFIGELNPTLDIAREFKTPPQIFELDLDAIAGSGAMQPNIAAVSHLPRILRDLVVVASNTTAAAILACAKDAAHAAATAARASVAVSLFDFYTKKSDNSKPGDPAGGDDASYGLRLIVQGQEENLTKDAVDELTQAVLRALAAQCQAQLRQ